MNKVYIWKTDFLRQPQVQTFKKINISNIISIITCVGFKDMKHLNFEPNFAPLQSAPLHRGLILLLSSIEKVSISTQFFWRFLCLHWWSFQSQDTFSLAKTYHILVTGHECWGEHIFCSVAIMTLWQSKGKHMNVDWVLEKHIIFG